MNIRERVEELLQPSVEGYKEDLAKAGFGEETIVSVDFDFASPCEILFTIKGAVTDEGTYDKLLSNNLAPIDYIGELMVVRGCVSKCYRCPYAQIVKELAARED